MIASCIKKLFQLNRAYVELYYNNTCLQGCHINYWNLGGLKTGMNFLTVKEVKDSWSSTSTTLKDQKQTRLFLVLFYIHQVGHVLFYLDF